MKTRRLLVLVSLVSLIAACGSGGGPKIGDARVGEPAGPNAALYFTATSDGEPDRLTGAATAAATSVEVHQTNMNDDGTMGMQPVEALELPADGTLVLEPGGYHLMLVDVEPLEIGETIDVTLTWETAGDITIDAEVVDPSDTMSDEG